MNTKEQHIILKKLDGQALTAEESEWLRNNASEDWDALVHTIDISLSQSELNRGNWEDVKKRSERPLRRRFMYRMAALAASLALILSFNAIYRSYQSNQEGRRFIAEAAVQYTHQGSGALIEMEKGCEILLLDESQLRLSGTASFSVPERGDKKPLVIYTNGLQIHVTGTQFKVQQKARSIRVELFEGSLELFYGDERKELFAGEYLLFEGEPSDWKWTTGSLNAHESTIMSYENQPLSFILKALSEHYQIDIHLHNLAQDEPYTLKLPSDNLDKSLELISALSNLKVKQLDESTYVLMP